MEKVYSAHESAYKKLKDKGAKSWHEMYATPHGQEVNHVGLDRQLFFEDVYRQEWFPKNGDALEIGSGTGHFIRWVEEKGFKGKGIEISKTALEIAKQQSENSKVEYFNADYCYSDIFNHESFDLILDGSCYHCIVEEKDRKLFLEKSKKLLKKNGVFLLFTMCSPVDEKNFKEQFKTQKLINDIFYVPFSEKLEGSIEIDNVMYMSQRKIAHWQEILKSIEQSGFRANLFRYNQGDVFSSIYIAATLL